MTRKTVTSSAVTAPSSRRSMLNGAFGLYLVLVLAFGYFSIQRLHQQESSLASATSNLMVAEKDQQHHSGFDENQNLRAAYTEMMESELPQSGKATESEIPAASDPNLEKPQQAEDHATTPSPSVEEVPTKQKEEEALEATNQPEESKSALDLELDEKYNEECVKLGTGHLEKIFAKEGACFSRKQVQQIIIDVVHNVSAVFDAHNVTNFLDSGTLLGSYRHKSIIPFDQDADIGITEEGYKYIQEHVVQFPQEYYMQVYDSDIHPKGTRFPELPIRVIHRESGLYADVFVYKNWTGPEGEDLVGPDDSGCFINCVKCPWTIKEYGYKEFHVPREWIYPLVDCPFAGKTVKCPREPEKYLDYMFGESYMEPVVYPY